MIKANYLSTANLKSKNIINSCTNTYSLQNWLDIVKISSQEELSKHCIDVCQLHANTKKWVLLVNPEDDSIERLNSESNIDTSKILRVNTDRGNIDHIEKALCKGNCSAIVLCNTRIRQEDLNLLTESAEKGKTQCIVINKATQLH